MDLLGSTLHFIDSPTFATPVGTDGWILTRLTISQLLPAILPKISAPTIRGFRSYFYVHLLLARIFRCLRFISFVAAGHARLAT